MNADIQSTLLQLFNQVIDNPDVMPVVPVEKWQNGSVEWQLLTRLQEMLERIQQSKQEARKAEERFSLAVQGANDGLWDWDLHTDIVYFSPRWKSMLGYEDSEIPHHFDEWRKRVHPDDLERALATVQAHLDGKTTFYELEHRLRHKDGSYRWILARGVSLRDASGKPYRMAGSHTDITQRKQAEEQLREKEEQYRSIFEATTDALFINNMDGLFVEANPAACRMHGYSYEEFIGHYPTIIGHPDYHHLVAEFFQTIIAGGQFQTRSVNVRKDGTPFPVEVHGTAFTYKGQPHTLAIIRDITEQVQAQQLLEQRVEERTRELSTLLEVSHNVASTIELRPLLSLILDQLKSVADYTGSAIFTLEGEDLVLLDNRGPDPVRQILHHHYPLKQMGLIWQMIARQEAIFIDDVRGDTPLARAFYGWLSDGMETTFSYIRAWMGIPLAHKERVIGMLTLSSREPGYFTPRHAALTLAIANQAAVAIENARLYEQAQELAALEERQRLARELHDSVSQALYGITLGSHTARTLLDRDPAKVAEPLNYVLSLAEAALAEMRALIFELRPESLETEGLVAALTKQAAALHARHDITVSTELCDEPDLPLRVKQELYRIAQEALHNTVKHAQASKVELRLNCIEETVILEVRDDGVGFDPRGAFPGHLGLRSMRERITSLGGTLQVESSPGQGTCICARIPGCREL